MSFLGNIGKALGGGNIMGMAMGAASMFFPPLGLASAAMGNLLGNAMGKAVGGAIAQMVQNMGQQQPAQQQAAAPPPVPQAKTFHVAVGGQQQGPYDTATLQGMVASGQLTRETLVWTTGMANWSKAGEVSDLNEVFGSVPPPMPPG